MSSFQILHNRHFSKNYRVEETCRRKVRILNAIRIGEKDIKGILFFYKRIMLILVRTASNYKGKTQWESNKEEIQSDSQEVTFIPECLSAAKPSLMNEMRNEA